MRNYQYYTLEELFANVTGKHQVEGTSKTEVYLVIDNDNASFNTDRMIGYVFKTEKVLKLHNHITKEMLDE